MVNANAKIKRQLHQYRQQQGNARTRGNLRTLGDDSTFALSDKQFIYNLYSDLSALFSEVSTSSKLKWQPQGTYQVGTFSSDTTVTTVMTINCADLNLQHTIKVDWTRNRTLRAMLTVGDTKQPVTANYNFRVVAGKRINRITKGYLTTTMRNRITRETTEVITALASLHRITAERSNLITPRGLTAAPNIYDTVIYAYNGQPFNWEPRLPLLATLWQQTPAECPGVAIKLFDVDTPEMESAFKYRHPQFSKAVITKSLAAYLTVDPETPAELTAAGYHKYLPKKTATVTTEPTIKTTAPTTKEITPKKPATVTTEPTIKTTAPKTTAPTIKTTAPSNPPLSAETKTALSWAGSPENLRAVANLTASIAGALLQVVNPQQAPDKPAKLLKQLNGKLLARKAGRAENANKPLYTPPDPLSKSSIFNKNGILIDKPANDRCNLNPPVSRRLNVRNNVSLNVPMAVVNKLLYGPKGKMDVFKSDTVKIEAYTEKMNTQAANTLKVQPALPKTETTVPLAANPADTVSVPNNENPKRIPMDKLAWLLTNERFMSDYVDNYAVGTLTETANMLKTLLELRLNMVFYLTTQNKDYKITLKTLDDNNNLTVDLQRQAFDVLSVKVNYTDIAEADDDDTAVETASAKTTTTGDNAHA